MSSQLAQTLALYPPFQTLPQEKQEVYMRLAIAFEDDIPQSHPAKLKDTHITTLALSPSELTTILQIGNKQLWQEFLSLPPVQNYIKGQLAFNSQIASRKTLSALQKEALLGNTQAARQINELSGVLNSADNNKVIVLHQVSRQPLPTTQQQQQP